MDPPPPDYPDLLQRVSTGSKEAWDELLLHVHGTLHAIAHRMMVGQPARHTLETSALVNEAYLKLSQGKAFSCQERANFEHAAARAMRQILIDHARARGAVKRGGDRERVVLTETMLTIVGPDLDLLALDQHLTELHSLDAQAARVVELHCFGGLCHAEVARNMDCSLRKVERMWRFARAWLGVAMDGQA